jgi:cob(I)alamin adenosyltransferase
MKIYTRTGDDGTTALFAGGRVLKDHGLVDAYGTVDELNSCLGLARAQGIPAPADGWVEIIQNTLFVIGSDLATPLDARSEWLVRLKQEQVQPLETWIDQMEQDLPELKSFILPGGTTAAATIHVARTVCRRAERLCVSVHQTTPVNPNVLMYLNRLSDFLFTLARWVNHQVGAVETQWKAEL